MYKKAIVLGSKGYMGSHLVAYLNENDYIVQTDACGKRGRLELCDQSSLAHFDWDVSAIFVMAGRTGTKVSFNNPQDFIRDNVTLLAVLLDSVSNLKVKPRIVFPSSRLVYRGSHSPLREDAAKQSRTVYAAAKQCCESLLESYSFAFDVPYTVLRIGIPFGNMSGMDYSYGTIGFMVKQAADTGQIRLYGDGSLKRSFSHIDDICRFLAASADSMLSVNQIYNMPGEVLSLHELAHLIARKYNARIVFDDWPDPDTRIESGSTIFDASSITNHLGISPLVTVDGWFNSYDGYLVNHR